MSRVGNELLNVDFGVTFAGSYTFVFINKLLNHASENYQYRKKRYGKIRTLKNFNAFLNE